MTVSVMYKWKDKDGNEHYSLWKNVSSISVNGKEVEFKDDIPT
jgi:hypothetical protein